MGRLPNFVGVSPVSGSGKTEGPWAGASARRGGAPMQREGMPPHPSCPHNSPPIRYRRRVALGVPDGSIDLRLVPEIESDGAVYLLESEGRERLTNAFG